MKGKECDEMNWMANLIMYCESGKAGECPLCKSKKIEVTEHIHGKRRSLSFLCAECKASDHFDGCTTEKDTEK